MGECLGVGSVRCGCVERATGAGLAHLGHKVACADKDVRFSNDLLETVSEAGALFIVAGTPQKEDGSADLSSVRGVARGIGRELQEPLEPKAVVFWPRMTPEVAPSAVTGDVAPRVRCYRRVGHSW